MRESLEMMLERVELLLKSFKEKIYFVLLYRTYSSSWFGRLAPGVTRSLAVGTQSCPFTSWWIQK